MRGAENWQSVFFFLVLVERKGERKNSKEEENKRPERPDFGESMDVVDYRLQTTHYTLFADSIVLLRRGWEGGEDGVADVTTTTTTTMDTCRD